MTDAKVINLADHRPHISGDAICRCGHTWVAVAPVGTIDLECPACRTLRGLFTYPIGLDEPVLVCDCGAYLFYITEDGTSVCRECARGYV